jgi:hypothetical protein
MTLRDKDRQLADRCNQAALAATEAVEWLDQHRDPSPQIANLQSMLRRQTVEARRLGTAAARPVSVGVFGPSQSGKSFLIGKLISPQNNPAKVIFGTGDAAVRQDFLSQVNPAGGDETTGLVTRFSLTTYDTPTGFPVVLRLLREVDIIKILANTFRFDLKGQYRIHPDHQNSDKIEDRTVTSESIDALAATLGPLKMAQAQPGMAIEDVFELREYVEKHLDGHMLGLETAESYWVLLERLLPFLDPAGRVQALAPLWATLEEFSDLYLRLKAGLDLLNHSDQIYTGLDALADRQRGVLHVNTLLDLDVAETAETGAPEMLTVTSGKKAAGKNAVVTLPMCIVTALTAELRVTLETAPWDFFTHTDLLDFPGARSRENKSVGDFLRDPSEPCARANCFLRGKVALLFDNYAAELDLNVMLLCTGPENQEVKTLPGLTKEWVTRTHGDTPAKRAGKPTALFYCLTKCDTLFVRKVGSDNPVSTRLGNNFRPYTWWLDEWTPGAPFDNLFLIRNPGIEDRGLFNYAAKPVDAADDFVPLETGMTADFKDYLAATFQPTFSGDDLVKKHLSDPASKMASLLELNDGGTSLLAQSLAPVCNPDLKYAQIIPRADHTVSLLSQSLAGFYESSDLEKRVTERTARIKRLLAALRKKPHLIGPFISDFQVEDTLMEAAYRHYRRTADEQPSEVDVFDDLFNDDADAAAKTSPTDNFGTVLIEWWARHLSEKVPNSRWCDLLNVDEEALRGMVEEIVIGTERQNVANAMAVQIDAFTQNTMRLDAAARRVAIFASQMLNARVNLPLDAGDDPQRPRFVRKPFAPEHLPEDPKALQKYRLTYFKDWMDAMIDLTVQNASWGTGGAVDVVANAAMKDILGRLGAASDG